MSALGIDWQALLDAYQGFEPEDPALRPLLRLDTGVVTCHALMGDDAAETLLVPIKGARNGYEQRVCFADELCDPRLREVVQEALATTDPFFAFDAALKAAPIEAARWIEEERLSDVEHLYAWLTRAGVEPDPAPTLGRKIIEFPLRREKA